MRPYVLSDFRVLVHTYINACAQTVCPPQAQIMRHNSVYDPQPASYAKRKSICNCVTLTKHEPVSIINLANAKKLFWIILLRPAKKTRNLQRSFGSQCTFGKWVGWILNKYGCLESFFYQFAVAVKLHSTSIIIIFNPPTLIHIVSSTSLAERMLAQMHTNAWSSTAHDVALAVSGHLAMSAAGEQQEVSELLLGKLVAGR